LISQVTLGAELNCELSGKNHDGTSFSKPVDGSSGFSGFGISIGDYRFHVEASGQIGAFTIGLMEITDLKTEQISKVVNHAGNTTVRKNLKFS
jgi:hypothetical protein